MRQARDTFLHFLADNLVGRLVHPIRLDLSDPSKALLAMNAINVSFEDMALDTVSQQWAVIDIVGDDELSVIVWVKEVSDILRAAYMTPLLDYINPASPVSTGSNLTWDRRAVSFRRVHSGQYVHYTCSLPLRFQST